MQVWMYYAAAVGLTVALSYFSRKPSLQMLGLALGVTWCVTRIADENLGHHLAPRVFIVCDTLFGLYVGWLVVHYRSITSAIVFALFFAMVATHWVAFGSGVEGSYIHMLLLDVLFALQLTFVGGSSLGQIIARRMGMVRFGFPGAGAYDRSRAVPRRVEP